MAAQVLKLANYPARIQPAAVERTVGAAIALTEKASARLEGWMEAGVHDVIITARSGEAVRARLAMAERQFVEQSFATHGVSVNWATGTVSHGRNRAGLSRTELRLLSALADADGKPVSRRSLVAAAWPRERLSQRDSHLTVYMCLLRKRLSTIGLGTAIRTERGVGYSLQL